GHPATRTAPRPTLSACSPTCVTQPIWTSSISPGSRSILPTSPFRTCAASSSARMSASEPFRLPIGERTASTTYASPIDDSIEPPAPGTALELVLAALLDLDAGARHEIPDGARDQHLSRPGVRRHARADVHSDAGDGVAAHLALARVQPGTDLEAQGPHRVPDGAGTANRARGAVEGGQKAVAGGSHLGSAPAPELAPHEGVVDFQQVAPLAIAELHRSLRRRDDVREEDRREHAIGLRSTADPGQQLLDFVEDRVLVSDERQVIRAGKLDETRSVDTLGEKACALHRK